MKSKNVHEYIKKVAFLIRKERERKDISILYMTDRLHLSDSYYRHLERATTQQVSLYKYLQMAQLIRIPLSEVLEYVETKNVNMKKETYKLGYSKLQENFDIDSYIKEIGEELRRRRKEQNKYQKTFGDAMGITSHYYGHIERGTQMSISLYKYKVIADILDTPLHIILRQVEENLNIK
ncbi:MULTISPECIES: helix-turn-helix domain-containing protein [Staphylococcus]|uniref:helix-turn-helix domain-containing protein n=1 Tax=Staphylococcus TaxID=1279 RepID=UPI0011CAAF32|nr:MULTISPECIES: helix-turn-helix transcriptional regulator [Staphylococcus]MEB6279123.1 helix-turn-helix domain-containing protein [Staphylococcus gallinarum]